MNRRIPALPLAVLLLGMAPATRAQTPPADAGRPGVTRPAPKDAHDHSEGAEEAPSGGRSAAPS